MISGAHILLAILCIFRDCLIETSLAIEFHFSASSVTVVSKHGTAQQALARLNRNFMIYPANFAQTGLIKASKKGATGSAV